MSKTDAKSDAKPQPNDHNSFLDDGGVRVFQSFDDMPLHQNLLRGIYSHGFERPSEIQKRAIVPMIKGGDIIAQAQSGTGKTGAFSIGTLARIDFKHKQLQALVLSPTRELALQTHGVLSAIGDYLADGDRGFAQPFVGGTAVKDDIQRLQRGAVVGIGTPGRVLDLMKRGAFRTDLMKLLVLDEADEMLSQGFQDQIYEIFRFLPKDVQVALFSATMPPTVLELAQKFMRTPTRILVKQDQLTLEGIKQFYVAVEEDHKLETLIDLYESISIAQSVIFTSTRRKVDYISSELNKRSHTVSSIHAEMQKGERERIMEVFRAGHSRVLVTTDLVARGIDVHHVNIVINFDLPSNMENYLHRIGRGGRYGRRGLAINFVSQRDVQMLHEIEKHYHTTIGELPMNFAQHLSD